MVPLGSVIEFCLSESTPGHAEHKLEGRGRTLLAHPAPTVPESDNVSVIDADSIYATSRTGKAHTTAHKSCLF